MSVRERKNWKEPPEIRNHIDDNHKHSSRVIKQNTQAGGSFCTAQTPNCRIFLSRKKISVAVLPTVPLLFLSMES